MKSTTPDRSLLTLMLCLIAPAPVRAQDKGVDLDEFRVRDPFILQGA